MPALAGYLFLIPVQGTFGHRDDGDVAIVPIASGYRHNETQELVITTNYAPTISELDSHELRNLKVAFPAREIVSARLFDQAIYMSFLGAKSGSS